MKPTNTITAFGGAIVLSLSLISCNSKDAVVKPPAAQSWGIAEPLIISSDGRETKYGDVNTSANATYSVDDRLVLKNLGAGVQLRFRTSCARSRRSG